MPMEMRVIATVEATQTDDHLLQVDFDIPAGVPIHCDFDPDKFKAVNVNGMRMVAHPNGDYTVQRQVLTFATKLKHGDVILIEYK